MRVCVVGYGTVGRWLVEAIRRVPRVAGGDGEVEIEIVGVANASDGFIHHPAGIDPAELASLAASGSPLTDYPGASAWATAVEGLREVDADVLVETSASPADDGEPGLTHMREAIARGTGVVTSNKWPVALAGVELVTEARRAGVPFRAESTVMSGTPVLATLTEGLAGAEPEALRGVLNATVNVMLTEIQAGSDYPQALEAARSAGLAEPDPSADVDGHDTVAKVMILSALVLGEQLTTSDVRRRGISELTEEEIADARDGRRILREVARVDGAGASVAPEQLDPADLLARVDGRTNAVVCTAAPLGEVAITGPGAGPELAGQGCLGDLIAIARRG